MDEWHEIAPPPAPLKPRPKKTTEKEDKNEMKNAIIREQFLISENT